MFFSSSLWGVDGGVNPLGISHSKTTHNSLKILAVNMMLYVVVTTFYHTNNHWHTITVCYIEVLKSFFDEWISVISSTKAKPKPKPKPLLTTKFIWWSVMFYNVDHRLILPLYDNIKTIKRLSYFKAIK